MITGFARSFSLKIRQHESRAKEKPPYILVKASVRVILLHDFAGHTLTCPLDVCWRKLTDRPIAEMNVLRILRTSGFIDPQAEKDYLTRKLNARECEIKFYQEELRATKQQLGEAMEIQIALQDRLDTVENMGWGLSEKRFLQIFWFVVKLVWCVPKTMMQKVLPEMCFNGPLSMRLMYLVSPPWVWSYITEEQKSLKSEEMVRNLQVVLQSKEDDIQKLQECIRNTTTNREASDNENASRVTQLRDEVQALNTELDRIGTELQGKNTESHLLRQDLHKMKTDSEKSITQKIADITNLQCEVKNCHAKISTVTAELHAKDQIVTYLTQQVQDIEGEKSAQGTQYASEKGELKKQLGAMANKNAQLRANLQTGQKEKSECESDILRLKNKVQELEKDVQMLQMEKTKMDSEAITKEVRLKQQESELAGIKELLNEKETKLQQKVKEVKQLKRKLEVAESEKKTINTDLIKLQCEHKIAESDKSQISSSLEEMSLKMKRKDEELNTLKKQCEMSEKKIRDLELEILKLQVKVNSDEDKPDPPDDSNSLPINVKYSQGNGGDFTTFCLKVSREDPLTLPVLAKKLLALISIKNGMGKEITTWNELSKCNYALYWEDDVPDAEIVQLNDSNITDLYKYWKNETVVELMLMKI